MRLLPRILSQEVCKPCSHNNLLRIAVCAVAVSRMGLAVLAVATSRMGLTISAITISRMAHGHYSNSFLVNK